NAADGIHYTYPVRTDFTDPYGNTTRYDFTGSPVEPSNCTTSVDPFVDNSGSWHGHCGRTVGLLFNIDHYRGSVSTGELLRREGRAYNVTPWRTGSDDPLFGPIIVLTSSGVTYSDDNERTVRNEDSNWDGLHFRTHTEYDSSGLAVRRRETVYDFPASGTAK